MTDFSHLKKLDVNGRVVEMPLYVLEGTPVLLLRSAMHDNKPYVNAVLKSTSRQMSRMQRGVVTQEILNQQREQDRVLFAKHVIVGWRGVMDSGGKPVEFSTDVCQEFLQALPDYILDDIKLFASTPSNFVDHDDMIDTEELEKN